MAYVAPTPASYMNELQQHFDKKTLVPSDKTWLMSMVWSGDQALALSKFDTLLGYIAVVIEKFPTNECFKLCFSLVTFTQFFLLTRNFFSTVLS
jgi:hypothetical protein